jgi:hypothetical protein
MTVILTADKGSYSGSETPIFTVEYDPSYAGKEVILSVVGVVGYTSIATKIADGTGRTTFQYRPSNKGNYTFVAQVTPCFIIFNCETSNKVTISVTGDLPCDPLDPLCNISSAVSDYKWIAYLIIIVIILMIIKDTGILSSLGRK